MCWTKALKAAILFCMVILLGGILPAAEESQAAQPPRQGSRLSGRSAASANFIVINTSGFVPASMTIEVGQAVTWRNATTTTHTLQSGLPSPTIEIYLPVLLKNTSSALKSGPVSLPVAPYLTGVEDFTVVLLPDEDFTYTFTLTGTHAYHLSSAPQFTGQVTVTDKQPTTIKRASPANGEGNVAVTRETIIEFSHPLGGGSLPATAISAQFGGQTLSARPHLSPDRSRVTLFYTDPLPASARVRVTVDGDQLTNTEGQPVDADGDGLPGGIGIIDFDTLSLSRIPNTGVWGYVYDSYNKNPDGSDRAVVGATIRVDGFPEANAVTDANGYFLLEDMPAPLFFVHIDGSTASNAPPGTQYATVGKPFHSVPGQSTQLTMDGETFNIYLPPMDLGDLQALSATQETEVAFGPAGKAELGELFPGVDPAVWDQTMVMVPPNSAMDDAGSPVSQAAIIPVPSERLPAPLPPFMNHQLDIAVIAPGASNFDEPAPACFPNLPDPDTGQPLPPGAKSALTSFNHDTGQWDIVGPMTVSADGQMVCTDPGVGIRAPGWHGSQPGTSCNCMQATPPREPHVCTPDIATSPHKAQQWSAHCETSQGNTAECFKGLPVAAACAALRIPKRICNILVPKPRKGEVFECVEQRTQAAKNCKDDLCACVKKYAPELEVRFCAPMIYISKIDSSNSIDDLLIELELLGDATREDAVVHRELQNQIDNIIGNASYDDLTLEQLAQLDPLVNQLENHLENKTVEEFFSFRLEQINEILEIIGPSLDYFSSETTFYALEDLETGLVQRGRKRSGAMWNVFLRSETYYRLYRLFPKSLTLAKTQFLSASPGQITVIPRGYHIDDNDLDADDDNLTELREFVIGTSANNSDTDGDGIPDGAEVQQGTDPLDGLPVVTGIIAGADTPGTAVDVCAVNDLAAVADSEGGVSVFDISNSFGPVIIAQVATSGSALAVTCAGSRVAASVGGGQLAIIDLSDPPAAQIVHQIDLGGLVLSLASAGNTVYAGLSSGLVVLVDLASGTVLNQAFLGGAVMDVAAAGDHLYASTDKRLFALGLDLEPLGSTLSPTLFSSNRHLFVGGGIAYALHFDGYNTFSLADPAQPSLITAGQTGQRGWKALVANGSGLGVAAVSIAPDEAGDINLYDLSDPAQTNQFLTTLQTPGDPQAVAIYNGLAYVADGEAGLQVINYMAYDGPGGAARHQPGDEFRPRRGRRRATHARHRRCQRRRTGA